MPSHLSDLQQARRALEITQSRLAELTSQVANAQTAYTAAQERGASEKRLEYLLEQYQHAQAMLELQRGRVHLAKRAVLEAFNAQRAQQYQTIRASLLREN